MIFKIFNPIESLILLILGNILCFLREMLVLLFYELFKRGKSFCLEHGIDEQVVEEVL